MNRDELRTRSAGIPPFLWTNPAILGPQDSAAGGTWIGCRPDGTWAALLNGYLSEQEDAPIAAPQTRGRLIPALLASEDPMNLVSTMDLDKTHSFRLWLGTDEGITSFFWDRQTLQVVKLPDEEWSFVTSSSLDQDTITTERRDVFEKWKASGCPSANNGLPSIHIEDGGLPEDRSIMMARSYSHTKSITQMKAISDQIMMTHWEQTFSGPPQYKISVARS